MKFSFSARPAVTVLFCLAAISAVHAEDTTPLVVNKQIPDVFFTGTAGPKTLSLKKTFRLTGVTGQIVHFTTNAGDLDVELFSEKTPKTVAAFLKGAAATDATSYNNSLIQRAIPNFVVQGGGFYLDSAGTINAIGTRPAIPSEAGIQNARGTIAMALSAGPDSGVGDFFFNLVHNTNLDDASNGGPFTVFGRVVGDLAGLDHFVALPIVDLKDDLGSAFTDVPLLRSPTGKVQVSDLVVVNTITPIPLVSKKAGAPSILKLKVKNNDHSIVAARISGNKLILTPVAGATGKATIRVIARNKSTGTKLTTSFVVDLQ